MGDYFNFLQPDPPPPRNRRQPGQPRTPLFGTPSPVINPNPASNSSGYQFPAGATSPGEPFQFPMSSSSQASGRFFQPIDTPPPSPSANNFGSFASVGHFNRFASVGPGPSTRPSSIPSSSPFPSAGEPGSGSIGNYHNNSNDNGYYFPRPREMYTPLNQGPPNSSPVCPSRPARPGPRQNIHLGSNTTTTSHQIPSSEPTPSFFPGASTTTATSDPGPPRTPSSSSRSFLSQPLQLETPDINYLSSRRNTPIPSSLFQQEFRTPINNNNNNSSRTTSDTPGSRSSRSSSDGHRNNAPELTSNILAVIEGRGHARGEVGMSCINMDTSHLILCQFTDTQNYSKTVTKINIFRPFEIVMSSTSCENGQESRLFIQLQAEFPYIPIKVIQRRIFNEARGTERLLELIAPPFASIIGQISKKYYSLATAAALFKYVELIHHMDFSSKSLKIEFQSSEKTMMIDSVTAQHLELVQNNKIANSPHSLFGVLNTCRTPGGIRLLRMNILQPSCDAELIGTRMNAVQELVEKVDVLYQSRNILGSLPLDLENVIGGLIKNTDILNDRILEQRINNVVSLKHVLESLPHLSVVLESLENDYLQDIYRDVSQPFYQELRAKLEEIISKDAKAQRGSTYMRAQRVFAVKSEVNPILDMARKAYIQLKEEMQRYAASLEEGNNLPIRLAENASRGNYLTFTIRRKPVSVLPPLPRTFLQVHKHGNVVTFTTEVILGHDHRLRQITQEIETISDRVISLLITSIRGDIGELYKISEAIANLDLLIAFATYSIGTKSVRPSFSNDLTNIIKGRHPILDVIKDGSFKHTPNNTHLSGNLNFMLITGPNMSGKTTYLKQVATLQILAQMGSFVPAKRAMFRLCSSVFSRIGNGDNFEESASSFGLEMMETNFILRNLTDTSLVIVDELGRATSQEEGSAISWAIAEQLAKSKAYTLFATHYLYLTKLESLYKNCINFKMETIETRSDDDSSKLKYTHILKRGVTDIENYGLKLAKTTAFPESVLVRAQHIANQLIRQKQQRPENDSDERPNKREYYMLGTHLKLVQKFAPMVHPQKLQDYFKVLQAEFKETYINN